MPTEAVIYPYGSFLPELMQIEFHLADHCNLNCKGCTHFSNLVKEPVLADYEQFRQDLRRLSGLFSNIYEIFLLGGEPLLNPDAGNFIWDHFTKFLHPKGDSDGTEVFKKCPRKNCTFLDKGKVAACCLPFVVHYFNDHFDESIPEQEGIDIYASDYREAYYTDGSVQLLHL